MSERFVFVMSVPVGGLEKLVGSKLKASKVLSKAPKAFRDELGDFFEDEELGDPAELLQEILDGKPNKDHAYEYGRLVEVVSCAIGKRLDVIEVVMTYGMPKGGDGCWNRALKLIGLPLVAKHWGADNLFFPWTKDVRRSVSDWPIRTRWSPQLCKQLLGQLETNWPRVLAGLSPKVLADAAEYADDTREELERGLKRLTKCLTKAKNNELVLVMDGSQ
ncbi:MAG: hypothetical protein JNM17_04715 [Archangium sp.]|nr:hypothetical protein [Archangium sp.]